MRNTNSVRLVERALQALKDEPQDGFTIDKITRARGGMRHQGLAFLVTTTFKIGDKEQTKVLPIGVKNGRTSAHEASDWNGLKIYRVQIVQQIQEASHALQLMMKALKEIIIALKDRLLRAITKAAERHAKAEPRVELFAHQSGLLTENLRASFLLPGKPQFRFRPSS